VSAISEQIADLEREIGGALLNRTSGRTRLTPHGQLFLAEARTTLLAADRAVEITNRSLLVQVGSLGIGFSCGVREVFLLASFATTANSTRHQLSLYEMRTPEQMDALTAGKIDVAFARPLEPPFDRTLRAELLYRDPVVVVLPRDHPLAGKPISIDVLVAERFVLCDRHLTPALFDGIVALCSAAGFSPNIVNTSATWSGVLTLVESGEGVALVPSGVRYLRPPGVVISPLVPQNPSHGPRGCVESGE
jgi:DNA-binding transcriptional LysR family regulator